MSETENLPATTTVQLSVQPEEAQNDARVALISLKKILDLKKKPVIINNERYMEFEDWVALGNMYGIGVKTGDAEPVEIHGVKGAKARAEVIRIEDGTVIGGADAYCLSDERNWKNKPFFQLASMAQTRAGSKALSNELRWVVALEGIKGTPAEEMTGINGKKPAPANPKPASAKKPAKPSTPKGIDEDKVVDAEITEKKPDWKALTKRSPALRKVCDVLSRGGFDIDPNTVYVEANSMNTNGLLTDKELDEIEIILGKKPA